MKGLTIAVLGILVATGPAFAHRAKFEPRTAAARTTELQGEKEKLSTADDQDGGPKAPPGAQEPGSAEALRAANELVALISPDLSAQITAQMTAGIWASAENTLKAKVDPATLSELHTEYERLMGKFSSEVFPEIMKDLPPLYAKYFTAQELQEMLAFNRTNAGTKMRQLSPQLMGEFMRSMVPRMQAFGAELNTSVKAIMERHGYTTGATNQGIASGQPGLVAPNRTGPAGSPAPFAPQTQELRRTAVTDQPLRLDFLYSINPDCTSIGFAAVRVMEQPNHGRIKVQNSTGFTNFPASNPRAECNKRRSEGVAVIYEPDPGYTGTDSVEFEAIFPNGFVSKRHVTIDVIA